MYQKEDTNSQSETLTTKAEENLMPAELNLTSTQNCREIKLTKFMATKRILSLSINLSLTMSA